MTKPSVEFYACLPSGPDDVIERGGFTDWADALKVAKEHAERTQTDATVWARWAGRYEIMFEVDGRKSADRLLRIFTPWTWKRGH